MEIGEKYFFVYDDKGHKLMKKTGTIVSIEGNIITLDNGELLNTNNIVRGKKVDGGRDVDFGRDA